MSADPVTAFPETEARVLQRAGRNLLVYQQIEQSLKALFDLGRVTLHHKGDGEVVLLRSAEIWNNTLGQIVAAFTSGHCSKSPQAGGQDEQKGTPHRLSLDFTPSFSTTEVFESLVKSRNHLVHQFFAGADLDTPEGRQLAATQLDEEYDLAKMIRDWLGKAFQSLSSRITAISSWLQTGEGQQELLRPVYLTSALLQKFTAHWSAFASEDGGRSFAKPVNRSTRRFPISSAMSWHV